MAVPQAPTVLPPARPAAMHTESPRLARISPGLANAVDVAKREVKAAVQVCPPARRPAPSRARPTVRRGSRALGAQLVPPRLLLLLLLLLQDLDKQEPGEEGEVQA